MKIALLTPDEGEKLTDSGEIQDYNNFHIRARIDEILKHDWKALTKMQEVWFSSFIKVMSFIQLATARKLALIAKIHIT